MPDSIAGRIVVVLLIGLTVSHLASMALYYVEGREALAVLGQRRVAERMAIITRLIDRTDSGDRAEMLAAVDGPSLRVDWSDVPALEEDAGGTMPSYARSKMLRLELGAGKTARLRIQHFDEPREFRSPAVMRPPRSGQVAHIGAMGRHMSSVMADHLLIRARASIRLSDATWLNFAIPTQEVEPFSPLRFSLSMLVMVVTVLALSIWAVRNLTAPLARFTRAAERIGMDMDAPPLPETGPREVRRATQAFNEMQNRIHRFIADRTQMLAAIAHDLRTPITRLRLRAELVEDEEQQVKILGDLDEMETMISSTLNFARDDAGHEAPQEVDMFSLLESICTDMVDTGHAVKFVAQGHLTYDCHPIALRRAFTNLIENAVKYGHRARLFLTREENDIRVIIEDEGPGIPIEFHEHVFSPFRRLEASRSRETGGTGLGLTVARTIVRAHGGEILLRNRETGGLRVEVILPVQAVPEIDR